MAANSFLILRADADLRVRIRQAAASVGRSVSAFVKDAVEKAIERAPAEAQRLTAKNRGVPRTLLRVLEETKNGGSMSYARAAFELCRLVPVILEDDVGPNGREEALARLRRPLNAIVRGASFSDRRRREVWEWFGDELPKCLALVPDAKRQQFLDGVVHAHRVLDFTRRHTTAVDTRPQEYTAPPPSPK